MSKLPSDLKPHEVLNVNVGVLGHVDSGKTSLVKALSTLLSTASLDKNPQSIARGITLDLGFSAFLLPLPDRLESQMAAAASAAQEQDASAPPAAPFRALQFTLVDCPGHASLIRTIIGGAQIIDMMILVVNVLKGIQTQTAECLVIGEICTKHLIVVLNKVCAAVCGPYYLCFLCFIDCLYLFIKHLWMLCRIISERLKRFEGLRVL